MPEYLYSPHSLYDRLADDTTRPWDSAAAEVEAAYENNHTDGALTVRHIRLVWTARLPA